MMNNSGTKMTLKQACDHVQAVIDHCDLENILYRSYADLRNDPEKEISDMLEAYETLKASSGCVFFNPQEGLNVSFYATWCLLHGWGVEQNADMAVDLSNNLISQRDPRGHYIQGICHRDGLHFSDDRKKAARCFSDAFEGGVAPAGHELAMLHLEDGELNDRELAQDYLKRTCERHYAPSLVAVGMFYLKGVVFKEDAKRGAELLKQAADADHVMAKAILGSLYFKGSGVERNPATGMILLTDAFNKGSSHAEKLLKQLNESAIAHADEHEPALRAYILAIMKAYAVGQDQDLAGALEALEPYIDRKQRLPSMTSSGDVALHPSTQILGDIQKLHDAILDAQRKQQPVPVERLTSENV